MPCVTGHYGDSMTGHMVQILNINKFTYGWFNSSGQYHLLLLNINKFTDGWFYSSGQYHLLLLNSNRFTDGWFYSSGQYHLLLLNINTFTDGWFYSSGQYHLLSLNINRFTYDWFNSSGQYHLLLLNINTFTDGWFYSSGQEHADGVLLIYGFIQIDLWWPWRPQSIKGYSERRVWNRCRLHIQKSSPFSMAEPPFKKGVANKTKDWNLKFRFLSFSCHIVVKILTSQL